MYYFWIIVIAVGIANRLWLLIRRLRYQSIPYFSLLGVEEDYAKRMPTIFVWISCWLRRNLTTPATFGDRCSRPYGWCTIPPRIQSLTISLFVILNIVVCSCSYRLTEGNLYWPEKSAQLLRFVSDRTGIVSLANFPLVWLFGMRNDVLIWITGWGFGTYNAFHRWTARVATIQAVLHSLGYTLMILRSGGWPNFQQYLTEHYFWNGEIATVGMCALLALSIYTIRRSHYEVFLVTHIALSIAVLWTMYYHVEIFTAGEWNIFIWPCVAIWVLDRILRLARILAFSRTPLSTSARATYDPCSNLVQLDVDGSKNLISPRPGSYYYVHMLDDMRYAHQSHPFTLALVSLDGTSSSITSPVPPASENEHSHSVSVSCTESDTLLSSSASKTLGNLVFLIRPYNGFTSRLRSICLLHPKKIRVLVDGPYGHTIPLQNFSRILFVVGGTGVALPLSYLGELLSRSSQALHIKIVWAVREGAFLMTILRDFHSLLGDERVEMEVHITRDDECPDRVLDMDLGNVRIMAHRPNVYQVVKEAAEDSRHRPLAVLGCGPALMADQARKASVQMLDMGYTGVQYFEESFKW
jgi:predicted ferric reductase